MAAGDKCLLQPSDARKCQGPPIRELSQATIRNGGEQGAFGAGLKPHFRTGLVALGMRGHVPHRDHRMNLSDPSRRDDCGSPKPEPSRQPTDCRCADADPKCIAAKAPQSPPNASAENTADHSPAAAFAAEATTGKARRGRTAATEPPGVYFLVARLRRDGANAAGIADATGLSFLRVSEIIRAAVETGLLPNCDRVGQGSVLPHIAWPLVEAPAVLV